MLACAMVILPLTGPPTGPSMTPRSPSSVGAVPRLVWVRHSAAAVVVITTIRVTTNGRAMKMIRTGSPARSSFFTTGQSRAPQPAASMASLV